MTASRKAYIGQEVERTEDFRFLTGRGTFIDDYEPARLLHAAILRSSVAHGRIASIDVGKALKLPGVHAVFTARDIGEAIPHIPIRLAPIVGLDKYLQPVIAVDKVRYVGEPLAVIIAESRAIAEDAAAAIDANIEPLPPIPDWRTAKTDSSLLFEQNGTNVATRYTVGFGDTDAVFATADYTRREFFRAHRHTAVPMETRGLVAEWDETRSHLVVTGATKVTFFNRRALAAMMQMPESAIDLIEVDVGGGFGVRGEFYPEDFLIPFAARKLNRAVKWIEDRLEHLQATNHSREIDCELEIACRRDGTILGLRGKIFGDMGAYTRTNSGVVPAKAAQFLHGPYRIPALRIDVAALMTSEDSCRHLSRARPLRGQFLSGAADRHGSARSRHRPGRYPPAQSGRRIRDALLDRQVGSVRKRDRLRQRGLRRRLGQMPRGVRLAGKGEIAGLQNRRPLSRAWCHLLRRKRWSGPPRERENDA